MYGSLSAAAKDLNFPFCEAAFGHRKEESELQRTQQMSSSLLQYRSAPGSLLGHACQELLVTEDYDGEIRHKSSGGGEGDRRNLQLPPPALAAVEIGDALQQNGRFSSSHSPYQSKPQERMAAMEAEEMACGSNVGGGKNFVRQSSSLAGFFSHLKVDKGMAAGFKGQISFSGRQKLLSQTSEMGNEGVSGGCDAESQDEISNSKCHIHSYPISWEDSSLIWDNLAAGGSNSPTRGINMAAAVAQDGGLRSQFSLPNTSSEMAMLEKLLQFQDAVPCKIRAKRGCATHPRSIAERVRRMRISERMRKLQELVPNMDKQTNTSDMLDFAVDYIKVLQRQVKSLTERRARCTCLTKKQRTFPNTAN